MRLASFVTVLALAAGVCLADDVKSGLQVGAAPGAFNVKDVTGPSAGKSLCYRCKFGGRPTVTIFTREINEEVASLVKQVDEQCAKNKDSNLSAFVVLLTDDPDKAEPKLKELAAKHKIENVPLTIFDGISGPPDYKLSEKADTTVLMWVKSNVKVNHAFAKGAFKAENVKAVAGDTAKILN